MDKNEFIQLVCAMLLGDGYLQTSDTPGHTRAEIRIEHSGFQEDYLLWKVTLLNKIFEKRDMPKRCRLYSRRRFDKRTKKFYENRLAVLSWRKYFHMLYKYVYSNKDIKFYKNIEFLLNNISSDLHTAIWFMDEGSECKAKAKHIDGTIYYKNPYFILAINSFTDDQAKLVQDWFQNKYSISPKLHYQRTGPILQFGVKETKILFQKIRPYLAQINSMRNHKYRICFERY